MKRRISFILALAAIGSIARAVTPDALSIAVCDFESRVEKGPGLGTQVTAVLIARISADHKFQNVERIDLSKFLAAHPSESPDDLTPDRTALIGLLTGANVLVTGRIFTVQGQTVIMAKITSVMNGRVYGEMVQGTPATSLANLTASLAEKIEATVTEKRVSFATQANAGPTQAAPEENRGDGLPSDGWGRFLSNVASIFGGNTDWSKEQLPFTVSAANYSQLSEEEIFRRIHDPANKPAMPPALPPAPAAPLFYAFVPEQVYESDVPQETVYRELAVSLAHRGYFNVQYQYRAGYFPKRIDYLLRVHYGVRRWRIPTVRTDKVTWGDDGLVTTRRSGSSAFMFGEASAEDPRAGSSPFFYPISEPRKSQYSDPPLVWNPVNYWGNGAETRFYGLIVVDAFRYDEVRTLGWKAPCIWSTFMAAPLQQGQQFSGLLRTLARTATPYFGETADGIQEFDVPPGKVIIGEPVVIPEPPRAP